MSAARRHSQQEGELVEAAAVPRQYDPLPWALQVEERGAAVPRQCEWWHQGCWLAWYWSRRSGEGTVPSLLRLRERMNFIDSPSLPAQ